ncbi:hypothetical protein SteCoe_12465 [Stentor coeruleus]|uniref:Uncharacterized protein n=1 Tax=Stentor coeruleus TaxID=5963 RepID=A0A1R2CAT1_9CILI|nr:hypothetical protein SteCoe_12465 [Stentor coeruleus]
MDLNCVRRVTLKAADLEAEPVTEEEMEILRKKLESIRKNQRDIKPPDYTNYSKEKVIQILNEQEKDHRKVEAFYRTQVDELEAELCDARELIISLIDERNEVDLELVQVRKQRQDFRTQVQCFEVEINKKNLDKEELNHNLELAEKQIHRLTQQIEEEQQKIEMLNTQTSSLQESLQQEKQISSELTQKLIISNSELEMLNKVIEDMQKEHNELRKHRDFAENLTDKTLKDAITKLSMIILAKDKSYTLTPEHKYLIKQLLGENYSKIIETAEKKYDELNAECKKVRQECANMAALADLWVNEFLNLCSWVENENQCLNEGDYDHIVDDFAIKIPEVQEKFKEAQKTCNAPEASLALAARLSVKDREQSIFTGRPLYGSSIKTDEYEKLQKKLLDQKKELSELRNKLHDAYLQESQMRDEITELNNNILSLKKNSPKVELMRFLQCQASIVEDLIIEQVDDQ